MVNICQGYTILSHYSLLITHYSSLITALCSLLPPPCSPPSQPARKISLRNVVNPIGSPLPQFTFISMFFDIGTGKSNAGEHLA